MPTDRLGPCPLNFSRSNIASFLFRRFRLQFGVLFFMPRRLLVYAYGSGLESFVALSTIALDVDASTNFLCSDWDPLGPWPFLSSCPYLECHSFKPGLIQGVWLTMYKINHHRRLCFIASVHLVNLFQVWTKVFYFSCLVMWSVDTCLYGRVSLRPNEWDFNKETSKTK